MAQTAICKITGKKFIISDQDIEFYNKLNVPLPTLCPEERARRRFAFRNERNLYTNKSAISEQPLLSNLHPDLNLKVYSPEEWWSDQWDGVNFEEDYDFNKPFFEQFTELQKEIPMVSLHITNNENCPFANYVGESKNCYMIFGSVYSEDCYYGSPYYCKQCIDTLLTRNSELCYECITCEHCYHCFYCQDCVNSQDIIYCYDCRRCSNCIGCAGLRNQKYCIFNKQYSQQDYEELKKKLDLSYSKNHKQIIEEFNKVKLNIPHRDMVSVNVEDCSGNYLYESKNTQNSFDSKRCHDCSYLAQTIDMKDCYDCNYTEENELCLDYIGYYKNNRCLYSQMLFGSNDIYYSAYCMSSKNLFGCIGLQHKEYCILNKQYKKEEYNELVPRIIEHMKQTCEFGEFFPISVSPYCYNETVAQEYFPLSKEEAIQRGYKWRNKDQSKYQKQIYDIPPNIHDVPDSITTEI